MNKILKYSLFGIGGIVALVIVAIALISVTFNPNDYKPLIVKMVKEKKQRTLNIEGDIKLAFWPKLGADLGKVTLSEHNGDKEFASIQSAKVFVSVLPLLSKQLVVDTVRIDGVKANIVRFKDGTTNFDDLLSKEQSEEIKFDIDGVLISNAALTLSDEMGGRHFSISEANIKTGHIVKNQPIDLDASFHIKGDHPLLDAQAGIKGTLLADSEHQQYAAKGLNLVLAGDVATLKALDLKLSGNLEAKLQSSEYQVDGLKLQANATSQGKKIALALDAPSLSALKDEVSGKEARLDFSQTQGSDTLSAKLTIANLKGSPKAFQSSGISGEFSGKQGARTVAGKFSSPFSGNLENLVFELPKLAGDIDIKDPALPNGAAKANFTVNSHTDVKQEQASIGLDATIDGSKLKGNIAVAGLAKPSIKFDLNADQLDLNKILGKQEKPKETTSGKPADLSALKNLLAQGSLNVGSIVYDKVRIVNLALLLKADGQVLTVSPLSAKVDDSQIKGSVGISHFEKPLYKFDLDIDKVDADRYLPASPDAKATSTPSKPLDLSVLKTLNAEGSLRVGSLKYGKIQSSNIRIDLKADGEKLNLNPFAAKIDDSQIKADLGITQFQNPHFNFNVDIDRLDADRYITKSNQPAAKSNTDTPIDLSALKAINANGSAKIGQLKLANVKTANVNVGLKAEGGLVQLAPFSADLYQGSMAGSLKLDARNTPNIAFKQDMKSIAIGPLLVDAIQNDMLDGKGTLKLDVTTQGNTVGALKKALNGTAALALADGAVKGIDIAGAIRDFKSKINVLKAQSSVGADQKKKTDFSEMTASFNIKNGVAHNDDLSMKAPLFRITGSGDIDIGNGTINYLAKPTVVASLKGQGGSDLGALSGLTVPVKITGTFEAPKYAMDFAGMGAALAQSKLMEKVGGAKGDAVKNLISGDKAGALGSLLGGKDNAATPAPADAAAPTQEPAKARPEDKVKKKLNKLLGF